jgi:predicted ATPase with chaperone activity
VQRYLSRVSGPVLDLSDRREGEPSEVIRERAYRRVLKIARTVADLAGSAHVETAHVSEAIQYRSLDRVLKG